MTLTIELKPEIEASLFARAAAQGVDMEQLVQQLLEKELQPAARPMSVAERIALWRAIPDLPIRPPLSDEAISRASIYDARG